MSLARLRLLKLSLYIVQALEALVRLVQRALLGLLVLPVQLALQELVDQRALALLEQRDQQAAQAQQALQARQVALAQLVAQAQRARAAARG